MTAQTPDAILQETKRRMHSSVEALKKEMATIRTGRANASLLDNVHVDYYGSMVPVNQMATVSVPEAGMLVIQPFDKSAIKAIETAILKSELGINPGNDGNVIRLPIPMLTEERRKELAKLASKYAENARIAIRNVRRDGMDALKTDENKKEISEDERKRAETDLQKLTDEVIKQADEAAAAKEKEILGK